MKRHITTTVLLALVLAQGLIENASTLAGLVSSRPHESAVLDKKLLASIMLLFDDELDARQSRFAAINTAGIKGTLDRNDIDHETLIGTLDGNAADSIDTVKVMAYRGDDNSTEERINAILVGRAGATDRPTTIAAETALPIRGGGTRAPASIPRAQDEPIGLGSIVLSTILVALALVIVLRAIARRRQ
jgi:hypothetical protein